MTENITPSNFDPRSEAIIAYTVMLIALAKDFSMTPADLSRWVLDQAMARGYDIFLFNGEKPTVTEYARHFSEGRKLIYHHVDMVEHLQSVSVCSQLYMTDKNHIPDAFYLYDVDIDVYYRYVSELARHHAAAFDIQINIEHRDGKEIATFFKG